LRGTTERYHEGKTDGKARALNPWLYAHPSAVVVWLGAPLIFVVTTAVADDGGSYLRGTMHPDWRAEHSPSPLRMLIK